MTIVSTEFHYDEKGQAVHPEEPEIAQKRPEEHSAAGKDPRDFVLCYLACPQDAAKAFLGAIMVTDHRARPLHFAYVAPVRPSVMQRLLYGRTLHEHVKIDVIARKLLHELPQRPDVLFVDGKELLAARRLTTLPTAYLTRDDPDSNDGAKLSSLIYETADGSSDQDTVGRIVATLESEMDLVEPFTRMFEALKEALKAGDA